LFDGDNRLNLERVSGDDELLGFLPVEWKDDAGKRNH
jgi:hypothetical protein